LRQRKGHPQYEKMPLPLSTLLILLNFGVERNYDNFPLQKSANNHRVLSILPF